MDVEKVMNRNQEPHEHRSSQEIFSSNREKISIFMILNDSPAQLPAVPTLSHGRHLFRQNIVWTLGYDLPS